MAPELAPEVMTFYSATVNEADRLTASADGALELVRTQELLRRYLPPVPASVLDVGGGPGVHARWLAGDGYAVHLVDPVPRHVEAARQLPRCTVELGDARELSAADASRDVVLLLGPLYHLLERGDRGSALAEAYRVLRPGGLLAAAGINRYASLFEHTAFAHLHKDGVRDSIGSILETQFIDGKKAFTAAYFHSGEELRGEVADAGFEDAEVFGIEGPTWAMLKATERHTGESVTGTPLFDSALTAARMAEPYPELLAASSHLLAVGRRPA
ncbi:methyltransferase domain-containing protein [Streptomyces sp. N2-109]|uniref:Methyltransferase domain-containing protein n=1 Tax=Streptomyces gossypii TaxID=2883101 RepID=A0ABT2JYJ9_9ACTN|nr:class I SAM-dependent methyltransferase [Streptomyces gossypii]MCT2592972.1 methyltransferase domain-containing protein [Streptomyces gossypii]MCT2593705.1 methyltransferase domain-containing protein [Streptomyces gossypii]